MLPVSLKNYDNAWIDRNDILSLEQKQLHKFNLRNPYRGINFYA